MDDLVENISTFTDLKMLLAVQLLTPKIDSKDFVDRPTKKPLAKVKLEFKKIEEELGLNKFSSEISSAIVLEGLLNEIVGKRVYKDEEQKGFKYTFSVIQKNNEGKIEILKRFLDDNFLAPGSDIEEHIPVDFVENPKFLAKLKNKKLFKVAKALNNKWIELSRKSVIFKNGEVSTLLDLPHPFMIPGGRFREYYYWDTYWILEGLMVCEMDESVNNIVKNFIHVLKKYGYIPNGLRKYYLYRSQPPYFPSMLLKLYNHKDGIFNQLILGEGLEMALKEHEFFETFRSISVSDDKGNLHKLNFYHVKTDFPRPESFGEDVLTFKNQSQLSDEKLYSNLKSGAESGWDFSSRWLTDPSDLRTINSFNQIPVELNALMYRNEKIIERFYTDLGDLSKAEKFKKRAEERYEAINTILWNKDKGIWTDYDLKHKKFVEHRFYFSNIEPLFYGILPPKETTIYRILKTYHLELFGYPGGIPASGFGIETHQQWDFPNAWAPHQHMMVDFLLSINERKMALHVAKSFMKSIVEGFINDNDFFEKYNVKTPGSTGAGGEYAPQTGFGWTNGTALSFLNEFGDELIGGDEHLDSYKSIVEELNTKTKVQEKAQIANTQQEITVEMLGNVGFHKATM